MPKTPQKKKIFHMESRLSIIFILNYQRKCGSKVENALMLHAKLKISAIYEFCKLVAMYIYNLWLYLYETNFIFDK